ncbi:hypothetical protein N7527_011133 [Penicillium freii]|nr:hypothetical protein N7527_011133 [Penicillium freii]
MELILESANDVEMTILLGDIKTDNPSRLCRLTEIEGYHIECADKTRQANGNVHVVPQTFFKKHGIPFDYDVEKHRSYERFDRQSYRLA